MRTLTRRAAPMPGARRPSGLLTRLTGTKIVATATLALLTLGAVFAATAGPREAQATRTQALRQTLASAPPLAQTIVASTSWTGLLNSIAAAAPGTPLNGLTAAQLGEITSQLHDDFNRGVVHMAPVSADWMGMTSGTHLLQSPLPAVHGVPVQLEVTYRQPFFQYTRLVAGQFPSSPGEVKNVHGAPTAFLPVVVSAQTAATFGVRPGSQLRIDAPQSAFSGAQGSIVFQVTGVIAARDPSSSFWTADPTVLTPDLVTPAGGQSYWVGAMIFGPGELGAVQRFFGVPGLNMDWQLPMTFGSLNGQDAQPLYNALTQITTVTPPLSGDVGPAETAFQVSTGILPTIGEFLAAADAVDTLLWLLYVSLAITGLVVLVLAARMIVMRRSTEFAMRRARGASVTQIALAAARGAAVAAIPAAVVGVALATLLVRGPTAAGGWWPPVAVLLVAVGAPAAIAGWQHRLPRRRAPQGQRRRVRYRLVAEATACLAAIAGIVVFRQQGTASSVTINAGGTPITTPGGGVNLYTSAAPVLIAIPAVIVVLRLYPLLLRWLLRGSARGNGVTAFVGLARAARTTLTPALPAFALVLALSVSAFGGMVRDAVAAGEVAASWQAAGADATILASAGNLSVATISPAAERAVAAVPGVTHMAAMYQSGWVTVPEGLPITSVAVDPASYEALVAATQTFPPVPASLLKPSPAGTPQPVLASPAAAAELGRGVVTLNTQVDIAPVRVRVAGVLSGTPALPGVGAFVVMPLSALHSDVTPPVPIPVNELLLTGSGIDRARLAAVVRKMIPGGVTTFRSDTLNSLSTAPLQHGTFLLFELALVVAAALGLAVMLLELALGAAEREATLARLATMGLAEGQRVRVVALEVLPAVVAAAVAALACALVLPRVVAPAINLSVFTGSSAPVPLTANVIAIAVPLAGLIVVAIVALAIEIRAGRRRRVAANLRIGE
jgi:putative ABC transport system permease protein